MNLISKLIILYIFIYLSILIVNKQNNKSNNIIKNKLYLFFGIVIFQFILNLFTEFNKKRNCDKKKKINDLLADSFEVGIISIVGYSIYIDLLLMNSTKNIILPYIGTPSKNSMTMSCIILLLVSIMQVTKLIVSN